MKNLIVSFCFAISFVTGFTQEPGKNFIDQNYIEVIGSAEKEIIPDKIYLKIVINEKNLKGQSLAEVETLMTNKLQEIGIDVAHDLNIKNFISNFQYYAIFKSDIVFIKEYELLLHNAEIVGKVFVELEKLGISNVSVDRLDHSEIEIYKQEIKTEAIKAAQVKAAALATAVNQNIGKALYISEALGNLINANGLSGLSPGIAIRGISSRRFYENNISDVDIEFEKIKIEYNVVVRFELK
jgi:uncharacterized protein